jgi:MFS family permease
MPIFVYRLTGSAVATSATLVLAVLPSLVLGPVAGVLSDRWDRRVVMLWVSLTQAAALLPLLFVDGAEDLVILNVVTAAQAGLAALFEPAKNALLPSLVPREQVPAANGLVGLNNNLARLVGASLGGVFLGYAGLTGVLLVDMASFVVAAALLIPPLHTCAAASTTEHAALLRAWLDGLAEIRRSRSLRVLFLVITPMALAQGLFVVLFVVFVTDRLGGGEAETGLLRGVQAIGAVGAGLVVGVLARRWRPGALFGWALVVFAALDAVTWNSAYFTTSLGWYAGFFAAMGAPGLVAGSCLQTLLQLHTSDETRGRVLSSSFTVFDGVQAAGMLLGGVLAVPIGLTALLNVQAGLYLVAGLVALGAPTGQKQARRGDRDERGRRDEGRGRMQVVQRHEGDR